MKRFVPLILVAVLLLNSLLAVSVFGTRTTTPLSTTSTGSYIEQWKQEYGSSPMTGARYQGPQPIGDADNDGKNELLISGRDCTIRVMKWNDALQTYQQVNAIHPPLYPLTHCDAGGMAIGDVTNDGKNEIAATWWDAIYHYSLGHYWMIGWNNWIFRNHGGSPDCLIGDFDNDGKNELIVSGGSGWQQQGKVGEIVVLRWNGLYLQRVAMWNDSQTSGYVYMAGLGDLNGDGKNEIACAYSGKIVVLNWNAQTKSFSSTLVKQFNPNVNDPFGCVCKDCDGDGKAELLVSFYEPRIMIFKWNGTGYTTQFDKTWSGVNPVIEGIDVGDTDGDGIPNVCVGSGVTHILQWNGTTYAETAQLPTFGWMAVVCIGDTDNDGKNEINCGNVDVPNGANFTEWVFKYQP